MKVIGLVGGIASGKTTVASVLEGLGAFVINADKLGHEAYRPGEQCYEKLIAEFGAEILKDDRERTIDRKALGDKVFGPKNKSRMETLTGIVWPEIRVKIEQQVEAVRRGDRGPLPPCVVVEAAIMIEAGWCDMMDEVWTVAIDGRVALERLMARNHFTEEEASRRMATQKDDEFRARHATVVLTNSGDRRELVRQIDAMWQARIAPRRLPGLPVLVALVAIAAGVAFARRRRGR